MPRCITLAVVLAVLSLAFPFTLPAWAGRPKGATMSECSPDAVRAGSTCVDKYEASVWNIPATQTDLIAKVKQGTATPADLTAGGATQVSFSTSCSSVFPGTFPETGNWTAPLYAVSIPGVTPTACVTWFQAEQACALSGKRLLTNQEWQRTAAGTPDTGGADNGTTTCNTDNLIPGPSNTGARPACVSNVGAFDMVGNVWEWVADWTPLSTDCVPALFGTGDANCFAGAHTTRGPGALSRGGGWLSGTDDDGVFTVEGRGVPSFAAFIVGFRCAR